MVGGSRKRGRPGHFAVSQLRTCFLCHGVFGSMVNLCGLLESLVGVNWVSKKATLEIYCIDRAGPCKELIALIHP